MHEEVRYTPNESILAKQLETAESMIADSNGSNIIIINYNNQIYNQNAQDEARFANHDDRDVTFGERL